MAAVSSIGRENKFFTEKTNLSRGPSTAHPCLPSLGRGCGGVQSRQQRRGDPGEGTPARAPWGPGSAAWGRHLQPQPGVLLGSCRNPLPLCWWLGTPRPPRNHNPEGSPHLSPALCTRGPETWGRVGRGMATVEKWLVGTAGGEHK